MARSRYNNFRTIKDQETKRLRLETFPKITSNDLKSDTDIIIKLDAEQRLDSIALEYLGDGKLWWVVCLMNDMVFPFGNDIKKGTNLRIPTNINRIYEIIDRGV